MVRGAAAGRPQIRNCVAIRCTGSCCWPTPNPSAATAAPRSWPGLGGVRRPARGIGGRNLCPRAGSRRKGEPVKRDPIRVRAGQVKVFLPGDIHDTRCVTGPALLFLFYRTPTEEGGQRGRQGEAICRAGRGLDRPGGSVTKLGVHDPQQAIPANPCADTFGPMGACRPFVVDAAAVLARHQHRQCRSPHAGARVRRLLPAGVMDRPRLPAGHHHPDRQRRAARRHHRPPSVSPGRYLLFTAASLLSSIAPPLPLLIAARVAQGIGAAVMMALTMAFVRETPFPRQGPPAPWDCSARCGGRHRARAIARRCS